MTELKDARGVLIEAGDVVIYGFGVSRSVAMAEGVVLAADHNPGKYPVPVSTTASGRVRIRVVRRSYDSGTKPVVDLAPDRIVVLKLRETVSEDGGTYGVWPFLPPSPLPTQDEEYYGRLISNLEHYMESVDRLASGGPMTSAEMTTGYPDYRMDDSPECRARNLEWDRKQETATRDNLRAVCARMGRPVPPGLERTDDHDE